VNPGEVDVTRLQTPGGPPPTRLSSRLRSHMHAPSNGVRLREPPVVMLLSEEPLAPEGSRRARRR